MSLTCVSCGSRSVVDSICQWCRRPPAVHACAPEHLFASPARGTGKIAAQGRSQEPVRS